jgi:RNA polymerase sigma factor (TIGR02999 family)
MGDVTELLRRWRDGDPRALEELTPVVYTELRHLAAHYMRGERNEHTLQPTALVHEAYLRLTGLRSARFENRVHFYGAAAQVMRRILIDHARQRRALKRARNPAILDLDEAGTAGIDVRLDLVSLDRALHELAAVAASPAKVVELRYFGGLSIEETAAFMGIAPATVKRHWSFARAWLYRALNAA